LGASHTLYFNTILLTNGGSTTRCPSASPRHHSCDRSRFPLGGYLIMKAMVAAAWCLIACMWRC